MFHTHRRWRVRAAGAWLALAMPGLSQELTTPELLARHLTSQRTPLHAGVEIDGYLFLNDSAPRDEYQEHAVVEAATGNQVDAIVFTGMNWIHAWERILDIIDGNSTLTMDHVDLSRIHYASGRTRTPC